MKTYILSTDNWFALGLSFILTKAGHETEIIDVVSTEVCFPQTVDASSIVIIDIDNPTFLRSILQNGMPMNMRPIFVTHYYDSRYCERHFADIFIPRKIAYEKVTVWIRRYLRSNFANYNKLTHKEMNVMTLLLEGKVQKEIAQHFSMSVKSISRFKISALNKMGLKQMNDKSLLIMNDYLLKTMYLTSFSHDETIEYTY